MLWKASSNPMFVVLTLVGVEHDKLYVLTTRSVFFSLSLSSAGWGRAFGELPSQGVQ